MGHKQIVHIVGMLLFLHENTLHHYPGGWILVGKVPDKFAIVLTRNALCNQVFLDHVDQVPRIDIL